MLSISTMLSLFGCASIVDKDVQEIEITTIPENCSISIKDKDGENVYTGQTPFKEELTKAKGYFSGQSYDIHIEKGGYRPVDLVVKSRNSGIPSVALSQDGLGWMQKHVQCMKCHLQELRLD